MVLGMENWGGGRDGTLLCLTLIIFSVSQIKFSNLLYQNDAELISVSYCFLSRSNGVSIIV